MKNSISILTTIFFFFSCEPQKQEVKAINFQTDYKFSKAIEQKLETDTVPWKYQISAADYATKGDYKNALIHWDKAMRVGETSYSQSQVDSINSLYKKVNAKEFILEKAKSHQVVIINEAHHSSHHRFFTKSLLQELYDQGYRHLGLEALSNGDDMDSLLNERKHPIQSTGWYIKEPQFGNMVREALEIGYKLFPYEQLGHGSGNPREIAQAKNIQKVIEKHPKDKFLIHCGFDHALEGKHGNWGKAMAGRLHEYTGIDPLTINQVAFSEKSDPKYNAPLLKAISPTQPTVLLNQDNDPYQYKRGEATTDIAVFHPNTTQTYERPSWLFSDGNKKAELDLSDITLTYPIMVLAYKQGEEIEEAVPVDIVEVQMKAKNCVMALKRGNYTIVVTNGKESVKFDKTVG